MFLSAVVLALIVGVLAGGGVPRLAEMGLRRYWLLAAAIALRYGTVLAETNGIGGNLPMGIAFIGAYLLILAWLWENWRIPGLQVAAVGIGLNTLAVLFNGGQMPVFAGAFQAAGFTPGAFAGDPFHFVIYPASVGDFVRQGGIFGDVVPIPLPIIRDVVSIGDLLLALGIFWAIVSSMTRPNTRWRQGLTIGAPAALRPSAGGEFQAGVAYASTFAPGPMAPAGAGAGAGAGATVVQPGGVAFPAPAGRAQSPYLRLARNTNFGLLWFGQLVSFFGDRVHQMALAVIVAQLAGPLEVGLTFAATVIPNVVLGPLAGALVDRWDRRTTMIACDLVRAGLVLLVPIVIGVNIWLVYGVAFSVATVSLLFRPAKNALIPRIVPEDELVTANSASSVNETIADLLGYPVAGAIVTALSGLLAAAFILDSATYLISAILLIAMVVPRDEFKAPPFRPALIWAEMVEGWNFLVRQRELLANTVVSAAGRVAVGVEVVCSILYAKEFLDRSSLAYPANYGLLMAAIGAGSVVGGVAVGQYASRAAKGPLTIAGFVGMGLALFAAGFVTNPFVALGLFFMVGAANTVWLIPTITLFQERTPQRLMGRVVSSRQALVFGVMATAMGVAGWGATVAGPATVLMIGGAICALAGLAGLLVPAMRSAR
jgi:DHA3 family macrolide efflux protein-like MFS transporter